MHYFIFKGQHDARVVLCKEPFSATFSIYDINSKKISLFLSSYRKMVTNYTLMILSQLLFGGE